MVAQTPQSLIAEAMSLAYDPIKFIRMCWPNDVLADYQADILMSLVHNDETFVRAGNMLGKDYLAGKACTWFFSTRKPVRIVTTSVDSDQLEGVLWGEIRRCLATSRIKLPIHFNHLHIRWLESEKGNKGGPVFDPISYLIGRVAQKGEGLQGHHCNIDRLPRTMAVLDEASGIDDETYTMVLGWAKRILVIGNPKPCTNFFFRIADGASIPSADGKRFYKRIFHLGAKDSPNYKLGAAQVAAGIEPTDDMIVPGVITYLEEKKRRLLFDPVHAAWSLDGNFPKDASSLLYPPDWLHRSAERAEALIGVHRVAEVIGVDPAMGGDDSVWTVADRYGIIAQIERKTPNTAVIPGITIDLLRQYNVDPKNVLFDLGGGGKPHVDRLAEMGYPVRGVGFGESVSPEFKKRVGMGAVARRKRKEAEQRFVYKNRRAEMAGILRELIDPMLIERVVDGKTELIATRKPWAIDAKYVHLRQQMAPIPILMDGEGRLYLPPKNKPTANSTVVTLVEMLGRSPDHWDSTMLCGYGLVNKPTKIVAGAA